MEYTHTFECPFCEKDIECQVDLGEHLVDVPAKCPECARTLPEDIKLAIYDDGLQAAQEHFTDRATDMHNYD